MSPSPAKPAMRARPGGGFNQGLGNFNEEHMEQQAMQQAVQQKSAQQQGAQTGVSAGAQPQNAQQAIQQMAKQGAGAQPAPPREFTGLKDEIKYAKDDVSSEIKAFFKLNTWLGIKPAEKDQQELAKQKQVHQRFQRLDQEQQQVAKQMYQEELQRKKAEEEEKERKQQMQEQQKHQDLPMPTSTKKGPVGPGGSKKQKAVQKLQSSRQQLSGPSSAN